ncbi:hypothetical protein OIU76_012157 [Salix suchowensis]|nr:hypothetical protein OIU76_012157 [Salix suchowensis]KAJ6357473.1 hypothetical protein OIU78_005342 [Salix suchowensis]
MRVRTAVDPVLESPPLLFPLKDHLAFIEKGSNAPATAERKHGGFQMNSSASDTFRLLTSRSKRGCL